MLKVYNFIKNHPLTKTDKLNAIKRFLTWQIVSRFSNYDFVLPFVNNSKLLIKRGMTGITGNIYVGLMEFSDMSFLLHFLRKEDNFLDIGANAGSYTILASGVICAKTSCFEPVAQTYEHLLNNININQLQHLVSAMNIGIGSTNGNLKFTNNLDAMNHVISKTEIAEDFLEVEIRTIDTIITENFPALIKIDVEGFESEVLKGAEKLLDNKCLKAIIIEINKNGQRYGYADVDIHNVLLSKGFRPFDYEPFSRQLISLEKYNRHNTIYVREYDFVKQRLTSAPRFQVVGNLI